MAKAITIPKDKSSFPQYLDFYNLREIGLKHIQELGGDIWTDHNLHDPGITILEVLCYAVTDLGYRTNFDIKDLLARSKPAKKEEAKTIFNLPFDDNFYSAAHILSCNPLTVTDYRKLFIDIPGVKNAWLEKAYTQEVRIGINCVKKELFTLPSQLNDETPEVKLNGLYDIYIEIEPQIVIDACGQTILSRDNVIKRVYEVYHAHRNLCEDVRDIRIYGEEEISVCAEIELSPDADPEEVMLQISLKVEEFLSPTLRFYTLQEMLEKGKSVEEIFEGRPLTLDTANAATGENCLPLIPSRGFIDVDELKKLDPHSNLHVSDVHNVIMQIDGVQAIHKFILVNYINDLPQTKGEEWCINLTKGYRPHMGITSSRINFLKGPLYFSYNKDVVVQRFAEEKNAKLKACLEPYQLDLPIPDGTYHDLQDYTSIQHEFPQTYGIGSDGINQPPTQLRKAQAKQLKGYLLFFDQILTNYLAQLAHIRDLFSMRRDDDPARELTASTYFSQILKDVPGAEYLIKNLETCQPPCSVDTVPEDYPNYLLYITEQKEEYQKRRNRFLDHLLARFSESFTDYVTQMYKLQKEERDEQFIINNKASFLENYPDISRNRGKAFDILQRPVWDTNNVAGLKKRISALLGISDFNRHTLSKGEITDIVQGYFIRFEACNGVILESKEKFASESLAEQAAETLLPLLADKNKYQLLKYSIPNLKGFSYTIIDEKGNILARSVEHFSNIKALSERVNEIVKLFENDEVDFIYSNETEKYIYKVIDPDGNELLESANVYCSQEEVITSQNKIEVQAISKDNYCRTVSVLEEACEFGFALVNLVEAHAEIELQSRRYSTYDKCLEAMNCFINKTVWQDITSEIIRENECFEYWLYNAAKEKVIFTSNKGYKTHDLALHSPDVEILRSGYFKFLKLAVDTDYYHNIEKDGKYGFELRNVKNDSDEIGEAEIVEAVHQFYYDTEQEREDRKWAIKYYLDNELYQPAIIGGSPGDFILEIKDTEGKTLLVSPPENAGFNYKTEAAAQRAHQKIRRRASNEKRMYYELLDNLEEDFPYSFLIKDRDNSVIAQHPIKYASAEERELAINVLMYGIRNQLAAYRHIQEGEGYRFELLSMDHDVLMRSETHYVSKQNSEEGWNEFLMQAGAFSNYKLSEKTIEIKPGRNFEIFVGKNKEYYFRLKAGNGEIIFQSEGYKTKQGCKKGIDLVKKIAANEGSYERLKGENNQHYFVIKAQNGEIISTSETYTTRANMEKGIKSVKNNASLIETLDTTDKNSNTPYSFSLLSVSGQILAKHTNSYSSNQERDLALQSVINYVSYTEFRENISGTAGSYTFALRGKDNRILLESTLSYADEPSAIGAFKAMVELAKEFENFINLPDEFRFQLVNFENQVIAQPPADYMFTSENERNAAIELIVAYVRNDKVQYVIENVGGAFYSEVTDHHYNLLLQGTVISPSKEKALVDLDMLAGSRQSQWGYASNPDNYFEIYKQNEICQFGFNLLGEFDEPVAKHPFKYHSQGDLHKAMFNVLSWLTDYTKLKEHFIKIHKWQEFNNWQNETLLHIDYEYLANNGLEAVKQLALDAANYKVIYKNSNYLLILMDSHGSTVAKHPKYLTSEKVANDKMANIILFMRLNAGWFEEPAQNKPFIIFNDSGVAMLQSTEGYNNQETLVKAYEKGINNDNFRLIPEQETVNNENGKPTEGFSFQLWNGNYHIADHVAFYPDAQQRDDALDSLVTSLQTNWLPVRLMGFVDSWYYAFSDFAGRVLLNSKDQTEFFTQTEAEDAYEKAILLALDTNNYPSVLRYQPTDVETKKCYYSFVINNALEGGSGILFTHGAEYDCKKDRDQAIQNIIDLLKPKQFKTSIKGTTCGYTYKLTYMFVPEPEVDAIEITLESAIHFPTRGEAMEAVNKLADLMKSDESYFEPEENEEAMWLVIDEYKNIQSRIIAGGDADAIKQELINVSNTGTPVSFSIETKETNGQYLLKDVNGLLLQTVGDNTDTEKYIPFTVSEICEKSDMVASLGQYDKYYRKINSVGCCLHGFELLDNHGNLLAEHDKLYFSTLQSNTVIGKIQVLLNSEGMHLVEHLMLRPTQTVLHPQYHFVVKVAEELLMHGLLSENTDQANFQYVFNHFVGIVKSYVSKDALVNVETVERDKSAWHFQWEVNNKPVGISEKMYCSAEDMQADKDLVHGKLIELKELLINEELGKAEIKQVLSQIIISTRTTDELKGDKYLPVPLLCTNSNGEQCTELSDPYSFRLTVVIPFWPKRFNNPQFREFMETTLRRETPAHILPRICWLNSCQMSEFEKAYQRWLKTLEIKNDHCDALHARNALIGILKKLRSNYPEAQLFSCEKDNTDSNILVLDNTRLG